MSIIVGGEGDMAFKKLICEEECYKQLEVSSHLRDTRLPWEWPAAVNDDRDPPSSIMRGHAFI